MQSTKAFYDASESMLQLWCHETIRVIGDRMWDVKDKEWLKKQLDDRLSSVFSTTWNDLFESSDQARLAPAHACSHA